MKTGLSLVVENNDSPRKTRIPEFYCELELFIRYLFDITSFVCWFVVFHSPLSYPGYVLSCTISSAGFTGPSSHIQPLCVRLKLMANILITVTVGNRVLRVRILVPTHLYMLVTLDCIPQELRFFRPPHHVCVYVFEQVWDRLTVCSICSCSLLCVRRYA